MDRATNPDVIKAAEDISAQLRTFDHSEQVDVFLRVKENLLNMRQSDYEKMQAEMEKLEELKNIISQGSNVINK